MEYLYASKDNFEDYASGRVLYHAPGSTAFPVRLASEIAERCFRILAAKGHPGPYEIYDPCCGSGYLLTVLGLLHGHRINRIYASDADQTILASAANNISLLTSEGMDRRERQLRELLALYGKPSHQEALKSLDRLRSKVIHRSIGSTLFHRDITASAPETSKQPVVHLVIADLPYGQLVDWHSEEVNPVVSALDQIRELLHPLHSIVAIVADKHQKLTHGQYRKLESMKVGKRLVTILECRN